MENKHKIDELINILSEKYNIPPEIIDKFYFLYFEILKRKLLEGKFYSSRNFGRFYGRLKIPYQIPEGVQITSAQFYKLYRICFKPSGKWAFQAGYINSDKFYEYCSRVINPCPNHNRKWFNPAYCSYLDRKDLPVPEKLLKWREEQKKNKQDT